MHFTPQVCSAQLKEVILAKLAWKRWSCIILFLPPPSGTENWRVVPWWGLAAAVLTRAELVPWQMEQAYSCTASPKSFCECLVLLCSREKRKTQQTSPAPLLNGTRPPSRAADRPQRCSWGFTRGLRGVAEAEQCPTARGRGAGGISAPFLLSPGKWGAPQRQGVLRGRRSRGAGRSALFPEQGRLSSGAVTVYVRQ